LRVTVGTWVRAGVQPRGGGGSHGKTRGGGVASRQVGMERERCERGEFCLYLYFLNEY